MTAIKFTIFSFFFFLFLNLTFAQELPVVWGEIPKEDLELTSFPGDSNATAIILCDYAESYINNELNLELSHLLRIKILNEKGFDWGTKSIYSYSKDRYERLFDLEAFTYNLDENGKIIKTELDDDDVFEEEIDDKHTKISFTMPNLKPGCIIEMKYNIETQSIFDIKDWIFQSSEPVRWSEYRIIFPKNMRYATVYSGYEPWAINNITEINRIYRGYAASRLGGSMVKCHQFRYAVKNAPAIRDEPYVTTVNDYMNRVDVQLAGYVFPGTGVQEVLKSWPVLVEELIDNDHFGEMIDVTGDVEDILEEITKDISSPGDKLEAIYNWVSKSITWSGENRIFAENDVDDVIEIKKGSSAEINFLFLSLLKGAGIEAYPVILSTRSNGKVIDLYPIISQFNYHLSKIIIDGKTLFCDATNSYRPMELLPFKVLGSKGLVIKEGSPEWVEFQSTSTNASKTLVLFNIKEDGSINGEIEDSFSEYRSLSVREDLNSKNETDIIKDLYDTESMGYFIDSIEIINKDILEKPIIIRGKISSDIYAQKNGDLIYINPLLFYRTTENPLKAEVRNFPVDYAYPRNHTILTNVTLPEGYELKERILNRSLYAGKDLKYSRKFLVEGRFIQIENKFEVKSTKISEKEYQKLKNFYAQLVALESEQFIIGPIEKTENEDISNTNTAN